MKEENRENDENLVLKTFTSNCGDRIDKLLEHPKIAMLPTLIIYLERTNTTKHWNANSRKNKSKWITFPRKFNV